MTKVQIPDRSQLPEAEGYEVQLGSHSHVCAYKVSGSPVYAIKFLYDNSARALNPKHVPVVSELLVWWNLNHRRLLKVEGVTNEVNKNVQPGIVTRWMKNGTIASYLKKFYLATYAAGPDKRRKELRSKVNNWILHVAEGLEYLHSEGIAHGDLRIHNIVINDDFDALICDFGLSVFVDNTSGAGGSERSGNYLYHPPEILENALVCLRQGREGDIWDFGLFCVEVFVNHPAIGKPAPNGSWITPSKSQLIQDSRNGLHLYRPTRPEFHGGEPMIPPLWALVDECLSPYMERRPTASMIVKRLNKIGPGKLVEI
ncbi:kinase-like domain-containing protein [Abortiporus biennis]|nr:kinase-like domain-containing protein [Abortiporus biennis]